MKYLTKSRMKKLVLMIVSASSVLRNFFLETAMCVFILLVLAIITVGCTKTIPENDENGTVKLLKTITLYSYRYDETSDKYKFEYDEQNRITKISEFSYLTKTLTYEGDDLVQVVTSNSNGNVEMNRYTKSGNTIIQRNIYNGVVSSRTYYTIELDNDGLPVKLEGEEDEKGSNYAETYEYQDGNLTKKMEIAIFPGGTERYTRIYYYDNEKSALYHCKTPKWYLIMELNDIGINNNVTYNGVSRSRYTYEYDITGSPVKRTCQYFGNMTYGEGIEYFTYITK
jgi:hypothetical protein